MKKFLLKVVPWLFLALFTVEIIAILVPKPDKNFKIQEFGRLPVLLNGRIQPLDSVGRNILLQIRNTSDVPLEEKKSYEFWKHPKKLKAAEWVMEVMMDPDRADTRPIFLIHHPELLNELELRGEGIEKSGLFYFTFNQLTANRFTNNTLADKGLTNCIAKIEKEGRQIMEVDDKQRSAYQKQVANLYNALTLYQRLKNSLKPDSVDDFASDLADFEKSIMPGLVAFKAQRAGETFDKAAFDAFVGHLAAYEAMSRMAYPLLVPPDRPDLKDQKWDNAGQALMDVGLGRRPMPEALRCYARMSTALVQDKPADFNQALAQYQGWLASKLDSEVNKGRAEVFFNNLQAFLHAMIIYLFAFLLAAIAMVSVDFWPNASEMLRRSAFYITVLALLVHTAGLFFRMWLEKRPPVTNLYSSAVFIGWMVVVLGVILERIYKVGIGVAASSLVGFITLIIAHNLANAGDTMEMMRAVLDSNFWLATHVVTVTLGYAAMFLAGMLAFIYIISGLLTPLLARRMGAGGVEAGAKVAAGLKRDVGQITLAQALTKMVYGIICFATLFSFVGTVLGGIWADQSWGRFWGWDPKENGALLIVIWCAVILHARWSGMVRERGLMVLAIIGNIITAWSWFGVNMLGVGLHSYGFMDSAFRWLVLFVVSQLVIIGLGLLPLAWWCSFRDQPPALPSQNGRQSA
jgi:cytochrome c-type biogenesis protein CcsB